MHDLLVFRFDLSSDFGLHYVTPSTYFGNVKRTLNAAALSVGLRLSPNVWLLCILQRHHLECEFAYVYYTLINIYSVYSSTNNDFQIKNALSVALRVQIPFGLTWIMSFFRTANSGFTSATQWPTNARRRLWCDTWIRYISILCTMIQAIYDTYIMLANMYSANVYRIGNVLDMRYEIGSGFCVCFKPQTCRKLSSSTCRHCGHCGMSFAQINNSVIPFQPNFN